jgi:hypothetical protein
MTGPESKFWNLLRDKLQGNAIRVENTIGRGTPDIHYTIQGISCWIELKIIEQEYLIKIRPEQVVFAHREHKVGGLVILLAKLPDCKQVRAYIFPYPERLIDIRVHPGKIIDINSVDQLIQDHER